MHTAQTSGVLPVKSRRINGNISTISSKDLENEFLKLKDHERDVVGVILTEVTKVTQKTDAKLPFYILVFPSDHKGLTENDRQRADFEKNCISALTGTKSRPARIVTKHLTKSIKDRLKRFGVTGVSFRVLKRKRIRVIIT